MPYINKNDREGIDALLAPIVKAAPSFNAGHINYILTKIVDAAYGRSNYYGLSQAIAAFECAKMEFYRRCLVPYEDAKCLENGDVYTQREFKPLPAIELPGKDEANNESTKTV